MPRFSFLIFSVAACLVVSAADAHASAIIGRPLYLGLDQGLVGYWSFEGNHVSGVHTYDASGNGNRGIMTNGPQRTIGKLGQGMAFDGVNDYVDVASPSGLSTGSGAEWTLSAWAKTNTVDSKNRVIISYGGSPWDGRQPQILMSDTHKWSVTTYASANDLEASTPQAGMWTHITGVGSGSQIRLYVNGELKGAKTVTNDPLATSARIGSVNNAVNDLWNGLLDDVRIYNRALNADEIKRLYKIGATAKVGTTISNDSLQKGLVGHWTFDGDTVSGTHVYDQSGQGNRGTMTNGPRPTICKIGLGLAFGGGLDGAGIALDDNANSPFNGDFTISTWVFVNENSQQIIFGRRASASEEEFAIYTRIAPLRFIFGMQPDCIGGFNEIPSGGISMGTWYHVVAVHANGVRRDLYVDGALAGSNTTVTTHADCNIDTYFGRVGRTDENSLNGKMDDVRIYDRALSPDEIKRLYKNGATAKVGVAANTDSLAKGLVGYWSFDGDTVSGTHVYDQSGQGNRGVMTNGPQLAMGKLGQGLAFDGVDDYVNVGDPASGVLDFGTGSFSIIFWANHVRDAKEDLLVTKWEGGAEGRGIFFPFSVMRLCADIPRMERTRYFPE